MVFYIFYIFIIVVIVLFSYFEWQKSVVFHPKYIANRNFDEQYRAVNIITENGTELEGCVYTPKLRSPQKSFLYFGGRGQDAVALLPKLVEQFESYEILVWNYRGYGQSGGTVSEKNLYSDALRVYDVFSKHYNIDTLFGYSLGCSIASYVASQRESNRLVLVGGFSLLSELVRQRYGFTLPMLRYRFATSEYLCATKANSVTLFMSKGDEIVPYENSKKLVGCLKKQHKAILLDGYSHVELLWCREVGEFFAHPQSFT